MKRVRLRRKRVSATAPITHAQCLVLLGNHLASEGAVIEQPWESGGRRPHRVPFAAPRHLLVPRACGYLSSIVSNPTHHSQWTSTQAVETDYVRLCHQSAITNVFLIPAINFEDHFLGIIPHFANLML